MSRPASRPAAWKRGAAAGAAVIVILGVVLAFSLGSGPLSRAGELARRAEALQDRGLRLAHHAVDLEVDGRADLAGAKRSESERILAEADALFARAELALAGAERKLGADNPALKVMRGVVAFRRGDYARAKRLLGELGDLSPGAAAGADRSRILVMLGVMAEDAGSAESAIDYFNRALQADEGSARARFRLGAAYLRSDVPTMALPALQDAAALAPEDGEIQKALGDACERLLRLDEAEAAYARAVEADPERLDFVRALEGVRRAKSAENDVDAAREAFEEGRAFERLGRFIEAAEFYGSAISSVPSFHAAHYRRGLCLAAYAAGNPRGPARREHLAQAVEHFRAALTGKPGRDPYRFALAQACRDTGRVKDTEAALREILRDNPRSGRARYELARLFAYSHEDVTKAREELDLARRLGVEPDPAFVRMLAEIETEKSAPALNEEEEAARLAALAATGEGDMLMASGPGEADPVAAAAAHERAYDALAGQERRSLVVLRARAAAKAAFAWERAGDIERAYKWYRRAFELHRGEAEYRRNVLRLEGVIAGGKGAGGEE